jgi:polar amino acid transport system permease protein
MVDSLEYFKILLEGFEVTVQVALMSSVVALCAAFLAGLGKIAPSKFVRIPAICYIEFFRGSSALIQLFWAYYVLPFFGLSIAPMAVGVMVLGLNVGAYAAEVVRSAILAVPYDQIEATVALNFSRWQRFRYVVLPQAIVMMLPPFGNNAIELIKVSALLSLITINEMTFRAQAIRTATGDTLIPFVTILVLYFLFSTAVTIPIRWLERRLMRRSRPA